jgi:hypothetical protein
MAKKRKAAAPQADSPGSTAGPIVTDREAPVLVVARLANQLAHVDGALHLADHQLRDPQDGNHDNPLQPLAKVRDRLQLPLYRCSDEARGIWLILPRFVGNRKRIGFRVELLFHHLATHWCPMLTDAARYRANVKYIRSLQTEVLAIQPILAFASRMMEDSSLVPAHNADFTRVRWYGTEYSFSKGSQAHSVRVLWKEWKSTGKGLDQATIGERISSGSSRFRLDQVLRSRGKPHPAMDKMIVSDGPGHFRLNSPPLPPVFPGRGNLPLR